jgi:hypothetical protein
LLVARESPRDHANRSVVPLDANQSTFLHRVLMMKKSVHLADTHEETDWRETKALANIRSWIAVPLVAGDSVLGLLSIGKTCPKSLPPNTFGWRSPLPFLTSAIQNSCFGISSISITPISCMHIIRNTPEQPVSSGQRFRGEPLELPSLAVQRRIAGILTAYDELMAIDAELREFPECLLQSAPVEFLGPIVHQIPQPCDHGAPGALSGQRVFRMRVLRSERTCSATATLKGSIRSFGLLVSKRVKEIDSNSAYSNLAQSIAFTLSFSGLCRGVRRTGRSQVTSGSIPFSLKS